MLPGNAVVNASLAGFVHTDGATPFSHFVKLFDVPDVSTIKDMFGQLLFNDSQLYRYNYCLVRFDNKLYVVEPVDLAKCTYVRKAVEYHPLQHMIWFS